MKKKLLFAFIVYACVSCGKHYGDKNTWLSGKTFEEYEVTTAGLPLGESFEFKKNGDVVHTVTINERVASSKGKHLYYKINGLEFTIYRGYKGWEKGTEHTIYRKGKYMGDYIIMDNGRTIPLRK